MLIYENYGFGKWREGFGTVRASGGDNAGGSEMFCVGLTREWIGGVSPTLTGDHENRITDYTAVAVHPRTTGALCANSHPGSYTGQDAFNDMLPVVPGKPPRKYIVRRLTPLECCRLQGYPDGWTENISFDALSQEQFDQLESIRKTWADVNNKKYKPCKDRDALRKWFEGLRTDSAEYKAYGNSLAIPCSYDVIRRVANAIRKGE